jgi:predicted acyl esterase
VLFFLTLLKETAQGDRRELTEGWLRGSHRKIDNERSHPWLVYHPHKEREPVPDGVEAYRINVRPTGVTLEQGARIGLRIRCADVTDTDQSDVNIAHQQIRAVYASGSHLARQSPSRVTIYHDESHPSRILLPVISGNIMGTYRSMMDTNTPNERAPYQKIWMDERDGKEDLSN